MDITEEQIAELVNGIIEEPGLFVVEIEIKGDRGGKKKLGIYLDGDDGISIDQCSSISRKLSELLEEKNPSLSAYTLEVSSYGVGKPLKMLRQYRNNIGRKVRVNQKDGRTHEGILKEVSEKSIIVEKKKKKEITPVSVDFDDIVNTQVLVSFK